MENCKNCALRQHLEVVEGRFTDDCKKCTTICTDRFMGDDRAWTKCTAHCNKFCDQRKGGHLF